VGDIIAEPLLAQTQLSATERRARTRELLEQVGMDADAASRYPYQFSGGQRQRIAIARALAVHPRLLVCDEPVSALDVSTQAQVLNLLSELQDRYGLTYLFITHDLSVVGHISDRIAVMYLGRIVEEGPTEEILVRPTHPYTAALLSAIPVPDVLEARARPRIVLRGEAEQPVQGTTGCAFAPRCAFAMDICRQQSPPPFETPSGVTVRCHLHEHGPVLAGATVWETTTATTRRSPQ
jgi:peptide/nickel transport system ATP-binding protein